MATAGQHAQPQANGNGNGQGPAPGATVTPIPSKPPTPMQVFRGLLDKMHGQIEAALPTHVDASRFFRVVITTVQKTPELVTECTRLSLFGCLMQCAQLGLEPDGLLGHAYLVPFNNKGKDGKWHKEVQLIIGYKGLAKLARQSGEVADIVSRVVYEKDYFEYEYGIDERLKHRPYMPQNVDDEKDNGGPAVFVYSIFRLKGGGNHFEVMSTQQVERIRQKSKSPDSPAWLDNWDEMAKAKVVRRCAKLSPASVEDKVGRAIALDERADAGLPQDVGDNGGLLIEDGDRPAGQIAPEPQADPSTLTQRKEIIRAAGDAKVAMTVVAGWYERASVEELTRFEAEQAIARLAKLISDAKAKSGEAIR
jgi:recombination protein RecT